MTKQKLAVILDKHKKWLSGEDGGERADLSNANLSKANLRGADLDYLAWPLSCGSIGVFMDDKQIKQLVYHAMVNMTNEQKKEFLSDPIKYGNDFHKIGEVPKILGVEATDD